MTSEALSLQNWFNALPEEGFITEQQARHDAYQKNDCYDNSSSHIIAPAKE